MPNPGASNARSRLNRSVSTRWNSRHRSISFRSNNTLPRCSMNSFTPRSSSAFNADDSVRSTAETRSSTVFGGVPGAMPQKCPASRKYFGRVESLSQSRKTGCSIICFTTCSNCLSAFSRVIASVGRRALASAKPVGVRRKTRRCTFSSNPSPVIPCLPAWASNSLKSFEESGNESSNPLNPQACRSFFHAQTRSSSAVIVFCKSPPDSSTAASRICCLSPKLLVLVFIRVQNQSTHKFADFATSVPKVELGIVQAQPCDSPTNLFFPHRRAW